jgi:hypothetical protein
MASHNAHETRRGDDGRPAPANQTRSNDAAGTPRADDPRDGVPSVGRGLDEDTGGDTISGFEPE